MIFNYCIYFMGLENCPWRFLECQRIIMSHGIKRQVDLKLSHSFKLFFAIQVFDLAVNNRRTYAYYFFATKSCCIIKPHWAIRVFEIQWFDTNFVRRQIRSESEFIADEREGCSCSIVCYVYLFILAYNFIQANTVFSKFV